MTFLAASKGGSSPGAEFDMENPTSIHNTNADYTKQNTLQQLILSTFEPLVKDQEP